MSTVKGKCKKCGSTYGYYSNTQSAQSNVSRNSCRKGGNCELDDLNS
ncbi:hypothetical protein [Polaribacter aestuariivivens]